MKNLGTRLTKLKPKLTPRRRGETLEKYLERTLKTEDERVQYWVKLTEEMYKGNPDAVPKAIKALKDKNPEACNIVEDTYAKLQGASN
jgi:beta-phosphoglucomutase-like phosphatase (HAD superfamily)